MHKHENGSLHLRCPCLLLGIEGYINAYLKFVSSY